MVSSYEIPHLWEEPDGLHDLLETLRANRPETNVRRVRYAYFVAEEAHQGQSRDSGEPYIHHPLEVAKILVDLGMDEDTIVAALLHDTLEDCPQVTPEKLRDLFGEPVLALVEGVTKLKFKPMAETSPRQRAAVERDKAAESLRKMLLAMAKDIRVMVIKLADRLHNMRTLDGLAPARKTRIATETMDVYAPLAARLGIWQIKWQLEDLAFKYLHPEEFEEISALVAKSRTDREEELRNAIVSLKDRLQSRGLRDVEVRGRPKHLYSIFNKMVKHGFEFDQIMDLLALRIIVPDIQSCYVALGIVHELWMPVPGLFYDYIAKPKPNGYQSLHTKVMGPHGDPLEVQIRTAEMNRVAEFGVAAHWTYKEGGSAKESDLIKISNLRQNLFDWSSENATSSDFLRSISTDLFSEQVFVFTPKGDVLDLPKESTPIDFAFRVHTDLGVTVVGAKVNGAMVPLNSTLNNGDVVELVTRSNALPSLDWLEFAKSAHARAKLRSYFRRRNKSENMQRGREAIERELRSMGLDPKEFLGDDRLLEVAKQTKDCETISDLLSRVGSGLTTVQSVVSRLRGEEKAAPTRDIIQTNRTREGKVTLVMGGLDTLMLKRSKCCDAIPGDEVVGYTSRGRGIMIHRKVCPNAIRFQTQEPERLTELEWPMDGSHYAVNLKIICVNRQGLLADVTVIFGEEKINVSAARIKTLPNNTAEIEITIDVTDTKQLQSVMMKISNFSDVISILRMFGRTASK
ncbi:MAG TPA: bifunctional (p)ppGpp synthetase/guanosine-3',5'-bis(diphosphate) 3'-pyrophosphohydrolase [Fimbriimonadaceae bacterium]|nr:bifunctional (p)ppGpp synthetase/guanosine-3',5'-bis(diphosphate) 3'-pyrophosphohydrolase [Fimbriimonadaceae bacterium]HRJ32372.1 bifunctional (p)ppGpp synthetase/guanosine-3',5'-bis(diphosphate) 3'-pyrophosphohydrolase [Fimbriimonadaceae bacterium]